MANLRNLVNMAFEEGARSPYDLKPLIVDKLVRSTTTIPEIKLNLEGIAYTIRRWLPQYVLTYLRSSNKIWLSGGAILKCLVDPKNTTAQWKTTDYDLFCPHNDFVKITNNELPLNNNANYKQKTARIEDVNFIVSDKFTSWEKVVEDFDINVVRFAYQECAVNGAFVSKIYATEETQKDFIYNRIVLNDVKTPSVVVLRNRVKKYVKRGFRDNTGLVIKNNLKDIYMENYD